MLWFSQGFFSNEEKNQLRYYVQTKSIPNNKIKEIFDKFKCNFVVKRRDESLEIKHQMQIKTDIRKKYKYKADLE